MLHHTRQSEADQMVYQTTLPYADAARCPALCHLQLNLYLMSPGFGIRSPEVSRLMVSLSAVTGALMILLRLPWPVWLGAPVGLLDGIASRWPEFFSYRVAGSKEACATEVTCGPEVGVGCLHGMPVAFALSSCSRCSRQLQHHRRLVRQQHLQQQRHTRAGTALGHRLGMHGGQPCPRSTGWGHHHLKCAAVLLCAVRSFACGVHPITLHGLCPCCRQATLPPRKAPCTLGKGLTPEPGNAQLSSLSG